ncbi:MAG: hypothetical protein GY765_18745 [bacterium]|nr:hypothetical protein [bacterium]
MRKHISQFMDSQYPPDLSRKESAFFRLMGFTGKSIKVREIRKNILVTSAGGLYNYKAGELWALEAYRTVDMMNYMILCHELRHALQDSHFDIAGLLAGRPHSDFDDRRFALIAAMEADASFAMLKCNDFNADVVSAFHSSDALLSFSPIGNTVQLYKAPDILKHHFTMPYFYGIRFVNAIFKKKKWKGVNRILSDPPESSEQILHPQKYLKRESPVEVEIEYKPEDHSLYYSGVIGEYLLNILLKPDNDYVDYAKGWGGDTFHIHANGSSYFLVWKSVWDENLFCSNFYSDFKRFIEKTYKLNFKKGNLKGALFSAGHTKDGYFFLRKIENRMVYVRTNNKDQMNQFIYGGNYD